MRAVSPVVWSALFGGLVLSGVAGIVNQVVWQRALKIFLGGSETLSAMVVVLVFLGGLGLGAAIAGRRVGRLTDPLRALALVELSLGVCNAAVAIVLGLDVTESVYGAQRLAVSLGLPLRLVYAVACSGILFVPTLLMGATVPLASEAAQRQLGASDRRLVPALFVVNTFGAALGAYAASAWLLPFFGQRRALFVAVACNVTAATLIGLLARAPSVAAVPVASSSARRPLSREEGLGFALGLLALGYEMVLFRVLALAHQPLPTTFATGLAAFLFAWSIGVALASRVTGGVSVVSFVGAVLVGLVPVFYDFEVQTHTFPLLVAVVVYAAPCLAFGLLYGQLVARGATSWGRDVGRYAALNTVGSCLGIVCFTLVGYEIPQTAAVAAIVFGLLGVALFEALSSGGLQRGLAGLAGALALGSVAVGWFTPFTVMPNLRTYWGRDGVVEVNASGDVWIDGLWHTALSDGSSHVGQPYSWLMAFAAVVAHGDRRPERALVIGAGVGISGVSLAGVRGLEIDGYEINHTLLRVLRDYPDQTLGSLAHPRLRWIWQDARTGLALDETTYDVILSAPLYLRQAGSSLLLSREYLRLVRSRLKPDGVLAVYSNEGSPAQTRLVQATLDALFAHRATWYDGLVTVASDRPLDLSRAQLDAMLARPDPLFAEARWLDTSMVDEGGLYGWYDGDRYGGVLADRVITDDQPLVEYPELADRWVGTIEARR